MCRLLIFEFQGNKFISNGRAPIDNPACCDASGLLYNGGGLNGVLTNTLRGNHTCHHWDSIPRLPIHVLGKAVVVLN